MMIQNVSNIFVNDKKHFFNKELKIGTYFFFIILLYEKVLNQISI